jgi:hypothetical protein
MGAAALASASIATAAVTVNGSTGVTTPAPITVNSTIQSTIDWGQNPTTAGSFDGSVTFTNTLSGLYSIIVGTSTVGATIDSVTLTGVDGTTGNWSVLGPSGSPGSLALVVPFAGMGDYTVAFTGTAPDTGGVVTGNLTFTPAAAPEAATWAMMLIGFAGIGLALRRRDKPVLAQLA